ncbi:MAG: hypothetical protein ACYCSP_16645 [Acidobacteriaceae bacterium]
MQPGNHPQPRGADPQDDKEAGRGGATACLLQAGPTGYVLCWQLAELGVKCEVIAPTLAPRKTGDRVKTGRRDAGRLPRASASSSAGRTANLRSATAPVSASKTAACCQLG